MIRFKDWLSTHKNDRTAAGMLARDGFMSRHRGHVDSLPELIQILPSYSPDVTSAAREAWAKYSHDVSLEQTFVYGFQYTYEPGATYIKIGFSDNPWNRLRAFDSASPVNGRMCLLANGDRRCEQAIHRALRKYNTQGEWYRYCTPIGIAIGMLSEHFINIGALSVGEIERMLTPSNLDFEL